MHAAINQQAYYQQVLCVFLALLPTGCHLIPYFLFGLVQISAWLLSPLNGLRPQLEVVVRPTLSLFHHHVDVLGLFHHLHFAGVKSYSLWDYLQV